MTDEFVQGNFSRGRQFDRQQLVAGSKDSRTNEMKGIIMDNVHIYAGLAVVFRQAAKQQDTASFAGHFYSLNLGYRGGP